ncbi:MAG: signal peptide peptidase SppA [Luteolibacter sp.]|jgi:protease-4|nr:signal peptide peptidase SppA [Luteolibacter sp.]
MDTHYPPPLPAAARQAPQRRSAWPWILGALGLGGIGLIALVIFGFFSAVATGLKEGPAFVGKSKQFNKTVIRSGSPERIAHIDLEGIITASRSHGQSSMVDDFHDLVDAAVKDDSVKAIVIRINSPGGEVTASDRLHRIIRLADEHKPVISYLDTIAASGGYYAACGSRHIISHPTTFTGSIGVIMQSVKYRDLIEKVGVSMEVYKSGALKDLLSGVRETSPEEITLVNELVQETYTRFLEVVSASRNKSVEDLRASTLTDGRIFSGKQALAAGMVDQNGFIEDAYDHAMELAGVSGASVIRYSPKIGIFDVFSQFSSASDSRSRVEIDVSERLLPRLQCGVPLYLHLDGY